jgi:large repetitive protein
MPLSLLVSSLALAATASVDKPQLDVFLDQQPTRAVLAPSALPGDVAARVNAGRISSTEDRFGVPTFFWAVRDAQAAGLKTLGLSAEQAARRHLYLYAALYRFEPTRLADAKLLGLHDTGVGAIIATFGGTERGVRIFRDELKVIMDRSFNLVAISGYLTPQKKALGRFDLHELTAVGVAYEDLAGRAFETAQAKEVKGEDARFGYRRWQLPTEPSPARTRAVYFPLASGLEPAFYVELDVGDGVTTDSEMFSYVISAKDGRLLYRKNLKANDAFTYRVWADSAAPHRPWDGPQGLDATPHPTGLPDQWQAPYVAPQLVTLQNGPISTNDAWLDPAATTTSGNNVVAFGDTTSPNGLNSTDVRPALTGTTAFDLTYDPLVSPTASGDQRAASITQLFFNINFMHDWFYDDGFNEAAGNAQVNNYGRGGIAGDPLSAEGQDYSGRNNADMSTPSDGARPRMQMYIWDGGKGSGLTVDGTTPRAYTTGTAPFGPQTFNISGQLVLADDGADPRSDGCSAIGNVQGKIALIDRGTCTFSEKAEAAQAGGAIGVIIANNTFGGAITLSGTSTTVTIPVASVGRSDGTALKTAIAAGPVNITLERTLVIDRDGTIDNAIVAHEWGHYISNRLIGDGNGISNQQGVGMGEGWGDFHAMLLVVREGDQLKPNNANWAGAYGLAAYTSAGVDPRGYYFGIRRVPYSIDFARNALTFKHITEGVALPTGVPTAFGASGRGNSEVHATGEVWATMLWESYAALLKDDTRLSFEQAQARMKSYLVAGYKATPLMPTFVEARDAILAVASVRDLADFALLSQAFARRGLGMKAVAPARDSQTNTGVVESFISGNDVGLVSVSLDDSVSSCDNDGVLDRDESGKLKITLKNVGINMLSGATLKVSSTVPGVTIGNNGTVTLPAFGPFSTASAEFPVSLSGVLGVQNLAFDFEIDDASLVTRPVRAGASFRANADLRQQGSALDDVEFATTLWTTGHNANGNSSSDWRRFEDNAVTHYWFGPNPAWPADTYLVSPPLQVGISSNFAFTFVHRYEFEADADENYDGGVIELSLDNGATWTDIGALATPKYPGKLSAQGANPLRGRDAFVGKSPNYPAFETATIDLGNTYAGKTVHLRFRIGSDDAAAEKGWEVDDLRFIGLAVRPFPSVIIDPNLCTNQRPVVAAGEPLVVPEGTEVTLSNSATDPDGEPVVVTYEQLSGPVVSMNGPTFIAPTVDAETEMTFEAKAFDGRAESLPVIQVVRVINVNQRPVAVLAPTATVRSTEMLHLEGNGNDPDGDAITFQWRQVAGPEVNLINADQQTVSFTAPPLYTRERVTLELVVSDGRELSEPALVEVEVVPLNPAEGLQGANLPPKGCGCTTGGAEALAPMLAFLLLALRRRRKQ